MRVFVCLLIYCLGFGVPIQIIMQSRHNTFAFTLAEGTIRVDSDFDSGNLEQAALLNNKLTLTPAFDPMNSQYSTKQSSKTFFHFRIVSDKALTLAIVIKNMKILEYFSSDEQFDELYRVCFGRRERKSIATPEKYIKEKPKNMRRVETENSCQLHFELDLVQNEQLFLAYHYPYPFEKCQAFLRQVEQQVKKVNKTGGYLYYRNELLIQSIETRPVQLLTLTENCGGSQQEEDRITKSLFPYYQIQGRPLKFSKPYVLLTCRVHSGQTSSSYALEGVINFLLSEDKRAKTLLRYFVFLIVPLVNPDGVFHGTYRMDTLGHNLNRFYSTAQSHRQPSIFAIQTLTTYYASRIVFFMDFHSHPHPSKGSFIYGNCHQQIQEQAQSQLYAKLLSIHSECFGYNWCNFSSNQMNSRDANELLTKDGSARVQMYKLLGHPLVFTMEMGYHGCPIKPRNEDDVGFCGEYRRSQKIFTTEDYQKHGESVVITLFTMLELNTASGLKSQNSRILQQIREEVCKELVQKEERFRQMDSFIFRKVKNISALIQEQFYQPLFKKFPFANSEPKPVDNGLNKTPVCSDASKSKFPKNKRELSLNVRQGSRTLEASSEKDYHMRSYKSTLEPKEELPELMEEIKSRQDKFKFAKQLNLNFNPFPITQRKKIYNVVGHARSAIKKNLLNDLNFNEEADTYSTITPDLPFQRVQHCYKSEQKDLIRNYKVKSFGPKASSLNEEDDLTEGGQDSPHNKEDVFILPRIPNKSKQKPFRVEVQLQQEYQKKYQIQHNRNLSGVNIKPTLRANAVRMRNLIKSMK